MLFEAYGGQALKKLSVFEWLRLFKDVRENVKLMTGVVVVVVQDFTEPMKVLKKCGNWCIGIEV
jgi:hypothetical protein